MDIVALWGRVPSLLDACAQDNTDAVRNLRLVSKEASKVALLALRSYTLTLASCEGYKTVSGASLLRHARLQNLTVSLYLSGHIQATPFDRSGALSCTGTFSPAVLLEAFVREAGPALSALTSLTLYQELGKTGGSAVTASVLDNAMMVLVGACPALTSLRFSGHLSPSLLRVSGAVCPQLSKLIFVWDVADDEAHITQVLLQQPSLLPQITTLTIELDCEEFKLPDMSSNPSITCLNLDRFTFTSEEEWLCLPPNLQHLRCAYMDSGPPVPTDGKVPLGRLLSLEMVELPTTLSLHVFAQLLRAAPAFQGLRCWPRPGDPSCCIECVLASSTSAATAANMTYLHQRMELPTVRDAAYCIEGKTWKKRESLRHVIASLPLMTGVAELRLLYLRSGDLGLLKRAFPDVTSIRLSRCHEMTDVELQELAVYAKLTTLGLVGCPKVSPVGLYAICQRLPCLLEVLCEGCSLLEGAAMEGCVQLLQLHGSLAQVVYKGS